MGSWGVESGEGLGSFAWEFVFSLSITLACSLGDLVG